MTETGAVHAAPLSGRTPLSERAAAPAVVPLPADGRGLRWRPLARDDAAALTRLLNVVEEADGVPYRTAPAEAEELFDGDWRDPATDTLGGFEDDGVMRAYAQVSAPPGDVRTVRAFLDGGVDPLWRGRGVGRELLSWSQARGRQLLARTTLPVPGRLAVRTHGCASATTRLLHAGGFTPVRYYDEMRRPLDGASPAVAPPAGVSVVAWEERLDEQVRLAHNEAFADHWGSEPQTAQQWTEGRSMFAPRWSRVALDDATGQVVGYLLSGRYEQDWELNGYSSGYVDLLGVVAARRGRGVASALLVAAMDAYRADGIEFAVLGVDTANPSGAHALYERLGFGSFHREVLFSIEL